MNATSTSTGTGGREGPTDQATALLSSFRAAARAASAGQLNAQPRWCISLLFLYPFVSLFLYATNATYTLVAHSGTKGRKEGVLIHDRTRPNERRKKKKKKKKKKVELKRGGDNQSGPGET